jgi:hypothetical protein
MSPKENFFAAAQFLMTWFKAAKRYNESRARPGHQP